MLSCQFSLAAASTHPASDWSARLMLLMAASGLHCTQAGGTAQDQVRCDMVHVYNCLTRREPQWGLPVPLLREQVQPGFAAAVQTLLDTKHFVKDHTSQPRNSGWWPQMDECNVTLLCCTGHQIM